MFSWKHIRPLCQHTLFRKKHVTQCSGVTHQCFEEQCSSVANIFYWIHIHCTLHWIERDNIVLSNHKESNFYFCSLLPVRGIWLTAFVSSCLKRILLVKHYLFSSYSVYVCDCILCFLIIYFISCRHSQMSAAKELTISHWALKRSFMTGVYERLLVHLISWYGSYRMRILQMYKKSCYI